MHDIDRTQMEYGQDLDEFEYDQYEYGPGEGIGETGAFSDAQAMELAAELLEVSGDEELEQFLGSLIKKAGHAVGKLVKSPVGRQLGGLLKSAAKKALPMVGSAVGGYFGGSGGAKIGSRVASTAGRIFGLELEGLSTEDQEYEAAKSFVQFAGKAAQHAAVAAPTAHPKAIAQKAVTAAARQFAPGLLNIAAMPADADKSCCPTCGRGNSGRWFRRGNKIILAGV